MAVLYPLVARCEDVIRHIRRFREQSISVRYATVRALRDRRYSLDEIASATGYSRERVRVILKRDDQEGFKG